MNSTNKTNDKPLSFYMSLKYPLAIYPEEEGEFTVAVVDLPECISRGATVKEAVEATAKIRERWIQSAYEQGNSIPLPSTQVAYGGTLLNIPCSLHRQLTDGASREGVSLSQHIVTLLSQQNALSKLSTIQAKLDEIQQQLDRKDPVNYPSKKRAAQARVIRELTLND